MPISPPLDKIPQIPAQVASQISRIVDDQINVLQDTLNETLQAVDLPDDIDCDDLRVQRAVDKFNSLQQSIGRLEELVGIVQSAATSVNTLSGVAQAIKAAQLLNPVTAPSVIAAELLITQNMTIANTLISSKLFEAIPNKLKSVVDSMQPKVLEIAQDLGSVCNAKDINVNDTGNMDFGIDLTDIDNAIEQQQAFLESIQEAPSEVFRSQGIPMGTIGKVGDYFVDTLNQQIYGPKLSNTEWGEGVKY